MSWGHIKISRKAYAEDPLWNMSRTFSRWEAWEDMIQMAAWKPYLKVTDDLQTVPLERGELVASLRYFAIRWKWGVQQVRTFIRWLVEADRVVAQRETQVGTVYLLVKYDSYQTNPNETNTPPTQGFAGLSESGPKIGTPTGTPSNTPNGHATTDVATTYDNTEAPNDIPANTLNNTPPTHLQHTSNTNNKKQVKQVKQVKQTDLGFAEQKDDVQTVVDFYLETHPKRRVVNKTGQQRIQTRLSEGFTVENLKDAIRGNAIDPWHINMGKHGLEYILRNPDIVHDFIGRYERLSEPEPGFED